MLHSLHRHTTTHRRRVQKQRSVTINIDTNVEITYHTLDISSLNSFSFLSHRQALVILIVLMVAFWLNYLFLYSKTAIQTSYDYLGEKESRIHWNFLGGGCCLIFCVSLKAYFDPSISSKFPRPSGLENIGSFLKQQEKAPDTSSFVQTPPLNNKKELNFCFFTQSS